MKITHNKVGQNLNLSDAGKTDKAEKAKATSIASSSASVLKPTAADDSVKVDLSSKAQDLKKIKEMAMAAPDIDQSKVDKFQKLIDAGQYKVDAKAIADRMVDEHLFSTQSSSNE